MMWSSLSANPSSSQVSPKPEKIVSITQVLHKVEYYEEQIQLWDQKLQENRHNSYAWMNYYLACRVVNLLTPSQNPHNLYDIYQQLETNAPDTYEYHYLTYLNGKGNTDLFPHLEIAFAMDPTRTEVLSHFVSYYSIKGDEAQMARYNKLWLESGEVSAGILNWNYNALIGLEEDAILLTYGDNDTYPSWMLQQVNQIRPDVTVLNIHLLRNREYIDHAFAKCEVPTYPKSPDEVTVWDRDLIPVVDHLFNHSSRPVYINVTLPKSVRDNYKDVLYTVGLAFKYSPQPYDNLSALKENYEQKFLTDYLKIGFAPDKSQSVLNSMNFNYLPAFITLYNYYQDTDEVSKAKNIKQTIAQIGKAAKREEEVAAVLDKPMLKMRNMDSEALFKELDLDDIFAVVANGIWFAETETSNAAYNLFLLSLLEAKEYELLELCKSEKIDWLSLLPERLKHLSISQLYPGGLPNGDRLPVTNISYEATEIYCQWLTQVYNNYAKKKDHQEVRFRLPTEEEWEYAARGGTTSQALYPWGGYYHKNGKGCYLLNCYVADEEPCEDCEKYSFDGGLFLNKADAYFPNDYGLYGCAGNAAEMVQGGAIAKGGSWEDIPEDCTITSQKEVTGPSPAIGFRVVMEIIK